MNLLHKKQTVSGRTEALVCVAVRCWDVHFLAFNWYQDGFRGFDDLGFNLRADLR